MNADPMIGNQKWRIIPGFRHVAPHAAAHPIYRTKAGMLGHTGTVTLNARLLRSRNEDRTRRIAVRIVTVHASDLARSLPPALGILQGGDLIRDQQIIR